jgi:hypothetical protein
MVNAAPYTGERILASPKTRRLAMEKGLDLRLLASTACRSPIMSLIFEAVWAPWYHPGKIRHRDGPSPAAAGSLPMHIGARVAASGCDEFISWLANDGDVRTRTAPDLASFCHSCIS